MTVWEKWNKMCQESKDYLGPIKHWWELHLARFYASTGVSQVKPLILKQEVATQMCSGLGLKKSLAYYKLFQILVS